MPPRRAWAKCDHPWHFSFKWKGTHYRFSLDKHLDSKSDAIDAAADIRKAIKAGTFGQPVPKADMTVRQLADEYLERCVKAKPRAKVYAQALATICRTAIPHPTRGLLPLGGWPVADVVSDSLERFREARGAGPGTNRYLGYLRAMWGWGLRADHVASTPFKRHGEPIIKLTKEHARSRRLGEGEEAKLLAVAGPHLHVLLIAAIETGMRKGEITSLQWAQVDLARASLFLPHEKTKTKTDRRIPISSRLRGMLEMRSRDPNGDPLPPEAYVFGTSIGGRVLGFSRAFKTAVLKAHGFTPTFTATAAFAPDSRAALGRINLNFHDLRREAGSRWMDAGVPLATIQRWLGHSNVAQTSTYLAGVSTTEHDHMRRFEERYAALQRLATQAKTGSQTGAQTVAGGHEQPNETEVDHGPTIM